MFDYKVQLIAKVELDYLNKFSSTVDFHDFKRVSP